MGERKQMLRWSVDSKKEGGSEREEAREIGNGLDFLGWSRAEIPPDFQSFQAAETSHELFLRVHFFAFQAALAGKMATLGTYGSRNIRWQHLALLESISNLNECLWNHSLTFSWNAWSWNIHAISINTKVQHNCSPSETVWFCPVCWRRWNYRSGKKGDFKQNVGWGPQIFSLMVWISSFQSGGPDPAFPAPSLIVKDIKSQKMNKKTHCCVYCHYNRLLKMFSQKSKPETNVVSNSHIDESGPKIIPLRTKCSNKIVCWHYLKWYFT